MAEQQRAVISHYHHQEDPGARVLSALRKVRGNLDGLSPVELAPVNGFHVRGRQATAELAELAGVRAGERVLDIGAGPGGARRATSPPSAAARWWAWT